MHAAAEGYLHSSTTWFSTPTSLCANATSSPSRSAATFSGRLQLTQHQQQQDDQSEGTQLDMLKLVEDGFGGDAMATWGVQLQARA
jgi:hypothetical protein